MNCLYTKLIRIFNFSWIVCAQSFHFYILIKSNNRYGIVKNKNNYNKLYLTSTLKEKKKLSEKIKINYIAALRHMKLCLRRVSIMTDAEKFLLCLCLGCYLSIVSRGYLSNNRALQLLSACLFVISSYATELGYGICR